MEAIVSKFLSILNHSKIMYSVFFFGIWNCVKERNRILALPNTTNCFKYLGFSAFILSYNRNEITDYFVCTANAHAWVSCILC